MPALRSLSGKEVVRIFESFGWSVARQRGSHKGTLRSLIRAAGLTVDEFLAGT